RLLRPRSRGLQPLRRGAHGHRRRGRRGPRHRYRVGRGGQLAYPAARCARPRRRRAGGQVHAPLLGRARRRGVRLQRGEVARAWHALLYPLFGVPAPDWTETLPDQIQFELSAPVEPDDEEADAEGAEDDEEAEDEEDEE